MKKILLLSDTHSYIDDRILHYAEQADEVWHAGDIGNLKVTDTLKKVKLLRAVYGYIDDAEARKEFPLNAVFECEGMKVWITHIGGYPGKYPTRIKEGFMLYKPDVFICCHSHILKVQYDKQYQCLTMNPGAAGTHGFHQMRTMLRFEIVNGKMQNLEVIELGKRG